MKEKHDVPTVHDGRLFEAIQALVSGQPVIKKRLVIAISILIPLQYLNSLSKQLSERLEKVLEISTASGAVKNADGEVMISAIENSLKNKHNKTCCELAKEIFNIYQLDCEDKLVKEASSVKNNSLHSRS